MYANSAYNLSHTSIMQDATAERDERHGKTERRKVCSEVILEENRYPGSPSKYSYMLPQPATRLNYDSDKYELLFKSNFRVGYPIQLLTSTLQQMKNRVNADDLKWLMQSCSAHQYGSPGKPSPKWGAMGDSYP